MCHTNYNIKKGKNKHLKYHERLMIERWYNKDRKIKKEIAELLNKSERTIRREIKRGLVITRDTNWLEKEEYSADIAQNKYEYNKTDKGKDLKISNDIELVKYIEKEIRKHKKSPEAIIGEIKIKGLKFKTEISAKTIRNYINKGDVFDLSPEDFIYKKSGKYKGITISNKIPPEKSIEFRAKEANERSEYGHWEGDCVVGKRKKGSVLLTFTERLTREEIIIKIKGKNKESVIKAIDNLERRYKKSFYTKFKTITFDNGSEFLNYKGIEKSCRRKGKRTKIYYAHPYCSGERGSNENNNRMIRRWIPKGTDIDSLSKYFIKEIEDWMNDYPRAQFEYKSTNMILLNI